MELGVRYFDTAANYGPSEEFLGKVLPSYRSEVAIATQTSRRTYDIEQRTDPVWQENSFFRQWT